MSGDDENADPNMSMFFQNMSHPILPNKKRHRNLTEFQRVERKECKSKQKRKTCTYYNHRDNDEWTFFYFVHRLFCFVVVIMVCVFASVCVMFSVVLQITFLCVLLSQRFVCFKKHCCSLNIHRAISELH